MHQALILGPGNTAVNESDKDSCGHGAQILRQCHRESGRHCANSTACILCYLLIALPSQQHWGDKMRIM